MFMGNLLMKVLPVYNVIGSIYSKYLVLRYLFQLNDRNNIILY